ncbi:hypothetical protein AGMMS50249_5350 [candidate division SR1 bacterium]|nr:hypothetical protein AGMMS50249_5350 [candidate division SR1 bacterium]
MNTDVITLDKKSIIAEWLSSFVSPITVRIAEKEIEIRPINDFNDEDWDLDKDGEVIITEKNRQAYQEAMKEMERGETLLIEDMSALTADEFQNLISNHLAKYEV